MILEALEYPFFRRAVVTGLLASVACGVVGTYVFVKRIASISGGLSHAAFGGIGLGYFLGFDPTLGAAGFAVAGGVVLTYAYRRLRSGLDMLIATLWAVGMALGMLLVSLTPGYAPDLMSYLFGSILFVPQHFVAVAAGLDVLVVGTVVLLFKELQAVAFDEEYAEALGVAVEPVLYVLLVLVALTVVALIRIVGVILVIALLTIPAAIARQWCDGLRSMMIVASLVGAVVTTGGLFLSYSVDAPTGPLIVLLAAALYAASALVRLGTRLRHRRQIGRPA